MYPNPDSLGKFRKLNQRNVKRVAGVLEKASAKRGKKAFVDRMDNVLSSIESIRCHLSRSKRTIDEYLGMREGTKKEKLLRGLPSSLRSRVRDIEYYMKGIESNVNTLGLRTINLESIKKDVSYLIDEYDMVSLNSKQFVVQTDDIIMKGVNLFPFYIVLRLGEYESVHREPFLCVPQVPNTRNGYPHPHVSEGCRLCMGEGEQAISKALDQARFGDFITIVQQILLSTGGGPYADIERWR